MNASRWRRSPLHGHGEGVGGLLVALGQGLPDHARVDGGGLQSLSLDDGPQVFGGGREVAGHAQVVDAVHRFSAGHLLENLGHLRVSLLHRALGVGVIFQIGQRLGDDGVPEVFFGSGQT